MKQIFTRLACAVAILVPVHAWAEEIGFGKDIPLEMAVRQIVPGDVKVSIEDGVDPSAKVSWGDETSWKKAVSGAAKSAGYVVAITDDSVKVMSKGAVVEKSTETRTTKPVVVAGAVSAPTRSKAPTSASRSKPRAERASRPAPRRERTETRRSSAGETVSGGGFVFLPEERKAAAPAVRTAAVDAKGDAGAWREYKGKPAPASVPEGKWVASTGDDLHALLSGWSEKEGWRLVWESDYRYSLNSSAQFSGDYIGAVTQLLASMKDVRPVVTAHFFKGNRTLVVGNNSLDSVN